MNDNQNHLVQKGRTTSRVLAPPGGQMSFSLGVAPPPAKKVEPKAPVAETPIVKAVEKENPVVAATAVVPAAASSVQAPKKEQFVSSNAFASGSNMNGAQVMTGRPSSRVLAPPGGHTSWTLG